jgi:hypothetical protein
LFIKTWCKCDCGSNVGRWANVAQIKTNAAPS